MKTSFYFQLWLLVAVNIFNSFFCVFSDTLYTYRHISQFSFNFFPPGKKEYCMISLVCIILLFHLIISYFIRFKTPSIERGTIILRSNKETCYQLNHNTILFITYTFCFKHNMCSFKLDVFID